MTDNYVKRDYGVPCDIGRKITYKGNPGIIFEDGGAYVAVNFDDKKPGVIDFVHPTDPNLVYGEMGQVRKLTYGQRRYRAYLRSECSESFIEWLKLGIYKHYSF
jgi:hypothetical protein